MSAADDTSGESYIIEFTRVGASVRATAIDPQTLTEASIVGPASLSADMLARQAVKKLNYVLSRIRSSKQS